VLTRPECKLLALHLNQNPHLDTIELNIDIPVAELRRDLCAELHFGGAFPAFSRNSTLPLEKQIQGSEAEACSFCEVSAWWASPSVHPFASSNRNPNPDGASRLARGVPLSSLTQLAAVALSVCAQASSWR
jgi:hypothetical protein